MQRLLKRTAQAQRQAARRARQHAKRMEVGNQAQTRDSIRQAVNEVKENAKEARAALRDAWEMGPIAPKRDAFRDYGVIKSRLRQDWSNFGTRSTNPKVVEQRCAWAGSPKQLNLAAGDRVVILDGPDQGKIDTIKEVNVETGTLQLEKYNQGLMEGMFNSPPRSAAMPISIDAVRLVYPLTNPETGVTRDVVIHQLKAVKPNMQSDNMTFDRWHHGKRWDRVVPALNTVIPWPEVKAPEYEAQLADTVREQVEQRTFYYGLLSPPMPEDVIDELRNKYSRFRTRHEDWYVEQKEQEAFTKERRHELLRAMQTPLDEFHEKRRADRDAAGEPELTDEMLAKLGELMSEKKAAVLEQAGVSEVSSKQ